MNAYIYPTPEALRQAVAARNTRRAPIRGALASTLLDMFLSGITHSIIPQSPLPPIAPGIDPVAEHVSPEDTDVIGFTYPSDAFWNRVRRAEAKVDAERVRLKAKRRAEKKAAKARKKFTGKWVTHKGAEILPADMPTMHLFYAARMIWNHSVPDYAKFDKFDNEPMKNYPDVGKWPVQYRRKAWLAMTRELTTRTWGELPGEAYSQFKGMQALSRSLNFK